MAESEKGEAGTVSAVPFHPEPNRFFPDDPSGPDTAEYFRAVRRAFDSAARRSGGERARFFRIGGRVLRLSFAGEILDQSLAPAFLHLAAGRVARPDLYIRAWDSRGTGIPCPPPPWNVAPALREGKPWRRRDGSRTVLSYPPGEAMTLFDEERGDALFWVENAGRLPSHEAASPLLALMSLWSASRGLRLVHAAAVGFSGGGVLITGRGGAGKSVAALSCLASDLLYAGDDYCLLSLDGEPRIYSLYGSGKVASRDAGRFPSLGPDLKIHENGREEKAVYFLSRSMPDKLSPGFPLRAVLISRVTGGPGTRLRPASPSEALLALAPSTIFQLRNDSRRAFSDLAKLVRRIPCLALEAGRDISRIPVAIAEFLSRETS